MQVFLTLLRILGILILAILLLVIFVLLLVLLCPIRYRVMIDREDGKAPEVKVRIHWLLHFIHARADYREKLTWSLKVLGIRIMDETKAGNKDTGQKKEKRPKEKPEKDSKETSKEKGKENPKEDAKGNRKEDSEETPEEESRTDTSNKATSEEPVSDKEDIPEKKSLWEKINTIPEKIAGLLENWADLQEKIGEWIDALPEKIERIRDKISGLHGQINDVQNRSAIGMVFGTTGELLVHLRPQKFRINGRLGMADPAATGQIFGVLGMLMPIYGETIHLEAVFDQAIIELSLDAKGRIRLGTLIWKAIRLIGKKEVRRLIKQFKPKKQNTDKQSD